MGKTTTIASLIQLINETRSCHIITIEDPIEYLYPNRKALVIQREVGSDTRSFSDALIAALRQDPDVIMLGEIRDANTANICLKAAETGHLVISTLHTPDVQSTLKRLVGLFEQDAAEQIARLADSVAAIVSIRLLPRAKGPGLVPAVEVMLATQTIRACIREPERRAEIREQIMRGRELYRMQTFDQHLADLVRSGCVSLQAAKAAATRPDELERGLMLE
jgi:twitching motility protein PilT